MEIRNLIILFGFIYTLISCTYNSKNEVDYKNYHAEILLAEELVSQEKYNQALERYEKVFANFKFNFLRDYKVASQLYLFTGNKEKGVNLIKESITNGWELKDLKNQEFLKKNLNDSEWKNIENQYDNLYKIFLNRIDSNIKSKVQSMFEKDQELAFKVSTIENEQEQEEFILKNFPKHSEKQLKKLLEILEEKGYPGEFLIGNNFWSSTILSHHNSIEPDYVKKDTLYNFIKPKLFQSLTKGYISPYEIALIEDWKRATTSDFSESIYGYLNAPNSSNISQINTSRRRIGLRPVELRNKLIDIENKTGINFYLPDWVDGKIKIGN
ncbi:hypothetical protein [uncultured Winogradskyella sp.]|uniref:hypothetical protein n=1 Tax=uncultured Winogradskyella sp. TaxID=395353 RepID=UPI00262B2BDB|nr:hypothetical protein [uncultured Winogradskyella sp.]